MRDRIREGTRRGRTVARLPRALALVVLALGCADGPLPDGVDAVWVVEVDPDTVTLREGESRALLARARGRNGSVLAGHPAAWSSSDTSIAMVDSAGRVTARGAGQATIVARMAGKEGGAAIQVERPMPPAVSHIEIQPAGRLNIRAGSARQLAVRAFADDGTELFGRVVTWASSDSQVARVDPWHVLKTGAMGTAALTATVEGRSAVLAVEVLSQVARVELDPSWWVLAPGEVGKINAYARDEGDNLLNKVVTWHSANPGVVTVAGAGRVTAVGEGAAMLTASVEGVSAQLQVAVATWTQRQLLTMDGDTAPRILFRVGPRDSVATGTSTAYEARSGRLRLLYAGSDRGRYEMRFEVAILRDGQPIDFEELVLPGTFGNDASGRLEFRTVNDEALAVSRLADGRIAVTGTGRTSIGGQEVSSDITFVYSGQ